MLLLQLHNINMVTLTLQQDSTDFLLVKVMVHMLCIPEIWNLQELQIQVKFQITLEILIIHALP